MSDPIGTGFAQSFSRPGGNVTGFTNIEPTMPGKWLELLKEVAPRVVRVAFIFNPTTAPYAEYYLGPFKAAAASLSLEGTRPLFAIPQSSNPPLQHRRAGGMAVLS